MVHDGALDSSAHGIRNMEIAIVHDGALDSSGQGTAHQLGRELHGSVNMTMAMGKKRRYT